MSFEFEHVASCHGAFRCTAGNANHVLERELAWILATSKLGALGMLGRFARNHPGTFYRLGKEALAERRARSAQASLSCALVTPSERSRVGQLAKAETGPLCV